MAEKRNPQSAQSGGNCIEIEYHADDYGLFPTQSQRILDCHTGGRLNGVSILTNGSDLERCMQMLHASGEGIATTVHLNIIEGSSLCSPEEVPLLVDENGVFHVSFAKLLAHSFLPGRGKYKNQLKREFLAQIRRVQPYLTPDSPLRLDSHAHYHMVPVAFDALMELILEEKLDVSYIRIPREQVGVYLRHLRIFRDFAPINLVKVFLLNLLARRNQRKHRQALAPMEQKLFMGVFLSGCMYRENVEPLLPDMCRLAQKQGKNLEVLAHPGAVYEPEDIQKLTFPDDVKFLTSKMRMKEADFFQNRAPVRV